MVDHITLAEKHSWHAACVNCGTSQAHDINPNYHARTELIRHGDMVKQGVTDGNIAIICHCSQHVTLRDSKKEEEVKLSYAFRVGDDALLCHKVHQHSGGNDSGLTEVNERQAA